MPMMWSTGLAKGFGPMSMMWASGLAEGFGPMPWDVGHGLRRSGQWGSGLRKQLICLSSRGRHVLAALRYTRPSQCSRHRMAVSLHGSASVPGKPPSREMNFGEGSDGL